MANQAELSAADRIDRAIARIEAASQARQASIVSLTARHSGLRSRIAEAVAALDEVTAQAGNS